MTINGTDYISTRGNADALDFAGVTLTGLARDGGLYVPRHWPQFSTEDIKAMRGLSYVELAARVMAPFTAGVLTEATQGSVFDGLWVLCPFGDYAIGAA